MAGGKHLVVVCIMGVGINLYAGSQLFGAHREQGISRGHLPGRRFSLEIIIFKWIESQEKTGLWFCLVYDSTCTALEHI